MPRRYHKKLAPTHAIYVGRPTSWGNPFVIGKHGTREEVIEKHKQWLLAQPEELKAVKAYLRGKDLCCWCYDNQPCHADTLLEIANAP